MKIIFVCTGNTCRSPIAESIATALLPNDSIQSRGLFAMNGQSITPEALEVILENNLLEPSVSQIFSQDDLKSDLILTMTNSHKRQLISQFGTEYPIYTLCEYVSETGEIDDPFGGSIDTYRHTFNQLYSLISKLKHEE
ncbi:protein arginine phosphatase [Staphylococcus hominis]|uniref:low molecular weight protein arginine phosphatase n=1 Tax=Staphylococcus hominis TaxID=1290 RepID=UPI0006613BCF|nr:low molecular weight protein arginine phosphatase [Staphylococcus hominis]OFM65136.1 protein tyrosine phosphatase [Staphylococcus sp. HMSC062C01]SII51068.1 protein-tyrosine-phosphatase [Mycobacteroides abscessus subsp. abscessus]GGO39638.1 low molecular weight protein-tyrosine-phosphatase PtpB [Plantactinospora veratri]KMU54626.1 Low molecular weight protein tyrosine phosphatase [Staphylococcus hominis]KMU57937.1 Low molecular weight protein tyrosine phosphatase [Staphylococcus hominis]